MTAGGRRPEPGSDAAGKRELRAVLRARRASLTARDRSAASALAVERLLGLPELAAARTVALYAATSGEADPRAALTVLSGRGIQVVYPRVAGAGLEFARVDEERQLRAGYRGIFEPPGHPVDAADIDVVVVPGVGFDRNGMRLGQGGGHYDRTLVDLPDKALRIGFCFACQVVGRVPGGEHDQPVDVIVTEIAVLRPSRPRQCPAPEVR